MPPDGSIFSPIRIVDKVGQLAAKGEPPAHAKIHHQAIVLVWITNITELVQVPW